MGFDRDQPARGGIESHPLLTFSTPLGQDVPMKMWILLWPQLP